MLDKLFTQHPYVAAWGTLELVYLVSLVVWAVLGSGRFGDVFVAGFLIPSIICSAIFWIGWKRKH
ncbi:hypothetical protein [Lentilactobacillus sunkii]|jgi:hypothetical protein|uniref:Integral membrane protein n=1 Tax=Lentilactobacillus sunkii TaxID=481719 RepID=A0A1E7XDV0_9LACO|nr:hypothetical protein [Lentilactobacillus sunkii]OFA11293.1 hypothetical protein LASUN_09020 [Lentilactobacillus sunkii]